MCWRRRGCGRGAGGSKGGGCYGWRRRMMGGQLETTARRRLGSEGWGMERPAWLAMVMRVELLRGWVEVERRAWSQKEKGWRAWRV